MGVLRRRDANLQTAFPIVSPEINILVSARLWIRFLKYVFGVDETSHLKKNRAFGVDETTLDFQNVHLV